VRSEASKAGDRAFVFDHARDFSAIGMMSFTDADIPHFKSWLARLVAAGTPLMLSPSVASAAMKKGFEEHTHFEIIKPIPVQEI
jgi:hypothetical protein